MIFADKKTRHNENKRIAGKQFVSLRNDSPWKATENIIAFAIFSLSISNDFPNVDFILIINCCEKAFIRKLSFISD